MEREALYAISSEIGVLKSILRLLADLKPETRINIIRDLAGREVFILQEVK